MSSWGEEESDRGERRKRCLSNGLIDSDVLRKKAKEPEGAERDGETPR